MPHISPGYIVFLFQHFANYKILNVRFRAGSMAQRPAPPRSEGVTAENRTRSLHRFQLIYIHASVHILSNKMNKLRAPPPPHPDFPVPCRISIVLIDRRPARRRCAYMRIYRPSVCKDPHLWMRSSVWSNILSRESSKKVVVVVKDTMSSSIGGRKRYVDTIYSRGPRLLF